MPFDDILVAVDLGEQARDVVQAARDLAATTDAAITVLHVGHSALLMAPPVHAGAAYPQLTLHAEQAGRAALEALAEDLVPDGQACQIALRQGDPADEIVACAEENNHDLIVMGTHGRKGLARLLMGSVAEQVVRHSSVPVLLVR